MSLGIDNHFISALLEESAEGYYNWDMINNTGYISPALKKLFGYKDKEFTNLSRIGEAHLLPADAYKAKEAFERHVKSKGKIPYNISLRFKHKQGHMLYLQSKAKIISWTEDHKPQNVIGFYINITPFILTEEKIKHTNELLELIIDSINAGVWEWEIATGREWWSNRFYTLLGYNENEIEASYHTFIEQLLHPDDKIKVTNAIENHLATQEPYNISVRLKCKDSNYRWFETNGKAMFNDDSKPIRMAGSIIDIHEAKMAQINLENSEFLLKQAGSLAKAGGWQYQIPSNTVHWSKPVYDIYELPYDYKPELNEVIKFFDEEYIAFVTTTLNEAISNGSAFDIELKFISAKKNKIWVRVIGQPVFNENGTVTALQGIFQDIDSIKKTEEFLKQTNIQKDKIFSIISHDLRSPVSQIRMFIELMLRHKDRYEISEKQLDLLVTIKRNAENTFNLLDDLLAWSTNQFRKNSFVPRDLLLFDIIKRVLEQLEALATEKKVFIQLDVNENLRLVADENMLKTILRNLISNAIKFSHKGGKVIVAANHKTNSNIITVQDFGIGIPEEDVCRLFHPTTNFTTYGTSMEKGTGLGLTFCKEFAEQHHGSISVTSKQGEGSIFKLVLPKNIEKAS